MAKIFENELISVLGEPTYQKYVDEAKEEINAPLEDGTYASIGLPAAFEAYRLLVLAKDDETLLNITCLLHTLIKMSEDPAQRNQAMNLLEFIFEHQTLISDDSAIHIALNNVLLFLV